MTTSNPTLHILHVITGLGQGGAESVLYRLATASSQSVTHTVVSLTDGGIYAERLRVAGVDVRTLGMSRGRFSIGGFLTLRRLIKERQPDVVQTWMYHSDLLGGLAARSAGVKAISWGIRNSGAFLEKSSRSARIVLRLCARLSRRIPAAIVCCAQDAAERHKAVGYDGDRMVVINNGYDLARFSPDPLGRERLRKEWDVPADVPLIGCVARWDPLKDHENLLRAIAALEAEDKAGNMRCALIGRGMTADNQALSAIIEQFGLRSRIILVGPRDDIPAVMNALDVHVLSSRAEGFPNVVAEAMACGTPCVVTQVGDAARIVGDAGWVAPAERPGALAGAIGSALAAVAEYGRNTVGEHGRERVQSEFALDRMVKGYLQVWRKIAGRPA